MLISVGNAYDANVMSCEKLTQGSSKNFIFSLCEENKQDGNTLNFSVISEVFVFFYKTASSHNEAEDEEAELTAV